MLYTLAQNGDLPKAFTKVSRRKVPYWPVIAISAGILVGTILNYVLPLFTHSAANIFVLVYSSSVLPGMVPWFVILISHLRFRKLHQEELVNHPFKMPGAPWTNWIALIGLVIILLFMFINPETQASIIVGVIFEVLLIVCYFAFRPRSLQESEK